MASDKTARALGGDPDKQLPAGWDDIDAKTGEPVGIDKGWGYQPGETVTDAVRNLVQKQSAWPEGLWAAYVASLPEELAKMFIEGAGA